MKKLSFLMALLISASASIVRADTHNFWLFQRYMDSYLTSLGINATITYMLGETANEDVDAQLECVGTTSNVSCTVTFKQLNIDERPEIFIQYAAVHEVCHLKLEHYALSVMDFITRRSEIELEADRCAYEILGEDKFYSGFTHNFYTQEDPQRTVPEHALRKAVRDVYGPQKD